MKKLNLLKMISIYSAIIFFTACGKTNCPAFPKDITYWFPYSVGDSIELYNLQDSIILPVSAFNITDSYSFNKRCDCTCEAAMSLKTNMDSLKLISINASIIYSDIFNLPNQPPIEVEITLYENNHGLIIPIQIDRFNYDDYSNWNYQDSAFISNETFYNVLTLENLDNQKFHELIMVKSIGILQLTDNELNIWKIKTKK